MIGLMALAITTATTPTPLNPSGKWVVDYQPDMCLVSRSFGPETANTIFALKPTIAMQEGRQTLFVLAPDKGGSGFRHGRAVATLLPSGQQSELDYVSFVAKSGTRGYELAADSDFVAALGDATGISIAAGKDVFSFATGKMQPVLNALATCNDKLFRSWGVDSSAKARMLPGADPAKWFPSNSYPASAKMRRATGRSIVILTVSADGRPTACRLVVKSDLALDEATCKLAMRNARYEETPGKTDRYAVLAVHWDLPR